MKRTRSWTNPTAKQQGQQTHEDVPTETGGAIDPWTQEFTTMKNDVVSLGTLVATQAEQLNELRQRVESLEAERDTCEGDHGSGSQESESDGDEEKAQCHYCDDWSSRALPCDNPDECDQFVCRRCSGVHGTFMCGECR